MSKDHRWLAAEIDRWVAEGLVTADQGARIRARYGPAGDAQPAYSWGLIVFFALGAIVIGLGVILLFAYNWAGIPKAGKLAIVFGAITGAHAAGLYFSGRNDWRAVLGEGTLALGTMLFGAGIWLVAQIYHIDEHFPTGFLVWGLGALALAWAVPSITQAIIATIVLTIWGTVEVAEFDQTVDWSLVLLVVGLGALVWRLRSAVLATVVLVGLSIQILVHAAHWGGAGTALVSAMALSVALIAGTELTRGVRSAPGLPGVMRFFGLTGFMVCAYILTFADAAHDLLRDRSIDAEARGMAVAYRWTLFTAALAAWGALIARRMRRGEGMLPLESWFYPLGLVCVVWTTLFRSHDDGALVAVVFNLIVLGVSGLWIVNGCREGRLRGVVLGSVVLGMLVFARYFDLFDSLAARGLVFVLFGGALFAEGFFYRKMRLVRVAGGEEGR